MNNEDFQTPLWCCRVMAKLIPKHVRTVLEPTPGKGNLVRMLRKLGYNVTAPKDFWKLDADKRFDCVVMNPPFTSMTKGYKILFECMERSGNVIALMPWLTIINSDKRTEKLWRWGLKRIWHLPRITFKGSRVQTCILQLQKGYSGKTFLHAIPKGKASEWIYNNKAEK